ncbi:hypothetical protein ACFL9U_05440 [Thermodesulfobacteriota bacterium]
MKNLQQELQKIAKEFTKLAGKFDKISRALEKAGKAPVKKTPLKTKPVKADAKKETAFAAVMKIINRSKKGVTTSQIMEKTGFNRVKVANIIFAARKRGKIKIVSKGVYLKA